MRKYTASSVGATETLGELLSKQLRKNDIVALCGGMGAGKTAFTRGILRGLYSKDDVSSPTFAIVHEYQGADFPVYHFDMFRVNSWEDLNSTGFFDYLDKGALIIIEWSENILGALPEHTIYVNISPSEDERDRKISIEGR